MENKTPFDLKAPSDPVRQAQDFARDLAYGVTQRLWTTQISTTHMLSGKVVWYFDHLSDEGRQVSPNLLKDKWENNPPSDYLLLSLGYVQIISQSQGSIVYLLTDKALQLLELPASPPTIFISYKRDQSSAFALLIEARLKLVGNLNPFVDKNLTPGDVWHGKLETSIKQCEYFVCLIGHETLSSPMVLKEIRWAEAAGCKIISIWHGCKVDDATPDVLKAHHFIEVTGESALEYETAVNQLLNALGYATY